MYLSIAGKTCLLSARWFTASSVLKLNRADWLSEWNSNHHCTLNHLGKRYSVGVLEDSLSTKLPKRKIYSLAGIYNDEIKNGIALFSMDTFDNSKLYWLCLYNSGVPEMELSGSDLPSLVAIAVKRLSDPIAGLIEDGEPNFHSNLLDSEGESASIEELLGQRDFVKSEISYQELVFTVEHSKGGLLKVGDGFSFGSLGSFDFKDKKTKDRAFTVLASGIFIGMAFYFFYPEKQLDIPSPSSGSVKFTPKAEKPSVDVASSKAKLLVQETLGDYLLGSNLGVFNKYKDWFIGLDSYSYGYSKESLTCSIANARCEVEYNANGSYKDFDAAIATLNSYFDDVVFSVDGEKITGVKGIGRNDVYLKKHNLSDLMVFDRGQSLVGMAQELSSVRPNLSMSINGGSLVKVESKDKEFEFPDNYERSFHVVGWRASGLIHQSGLVLSSVNRRFLTLNTFSLTKEEGWSFSMAGGYVMRGVGKK